MNTSTLGIGETMGRAYFAAEKEFAKYWRNPLARTGLVIEDKRRIEPGTLQSACIRGVGSHVDIVLSESKHVPDKLVMSFMNPGGVLADAVELYFMSLGSHSNLHQAILRRGSLPW